jgi:hypothetical protein
MKTTQAVLATLLGIVVLVAIVVGGYEGGWWLKSNSTNHQMHIDRQNYGTQLAYITKLENTITDTANISSQLDIPGLTAQQRQDLTNQKTAIVQQGCTYAHLITDVPSADQAWVSSNC